MHGTPEPTSLSHNTQAAIEPIFLSARETARVLGLSQRRIYRLMDAGEIEDTYHGAKRLAVYDSVKRYAQTLRDETRARRAAAS